MPRRQRKQTPVQLTKDAVKLLERAHSKLKPERTTLSNIEEAGACMKNATEKLDKATEDSHQDPSTGIMLRAAANAAYAAQDYLVQGHQDLEDAYVNEQTATSHETIRAILRKASHGALAETRNALELLEEAGAATNRVPFAPPEFTEARHNKAIVLICAAAIIVAAAIAVYNTQGFALWGAVAALAAQQATMVWALAASTRTGATTRRMDFYACVALSLTILLAACLILKGIGPRAAAQLTGAAFILTTVEWAAAKASAFHTQRNSADAKR